MTPVDLALVEVIRAAFSGFSVHDIICVLLWHNAGQQLAFAGMWEANGTSSVSGFLQPSTVQTLTSTCGSFLASIRYLKKCLGTLV